MTAFSRGLAAAALTLAAPAWADTPREMLARALAHDDPVRAMTSIHQSLAARPAETEHPAFDSVRARLVLGFGAAGRAARKDDDELWTRFSAAQDAFFTARHAVQAEQDAEHGANLATKEELLLEAERLVPVTDLNQARTRLRSNRSPTSCAISGSLIICAQ